MKKEKPHKHLMFVLNKVDLIPVWVTVSIHLQQLTECFCMHSEKF
jgi:nuclear GTP-binding protein